MSSGGTQKKAVFRKHTAEERKEEKRRYRARLKEVRKQLKELAKRQDFSKVPVVKTTTNEQLPTLDDRAVPGPSGLTRGFRMVSLAKPNRVKDSSGTEDKLIPKIHREQLSYDHEDHVGSGSFGNCYRGMYRGNLPVVIKKFKKNATDAVIQEARIIQGLQKTEHHPCLALLIGVSLKSKPFMLVTQFHGGSDSTQAYTIFTAIDVKLINDNIDAEWLRVLTELAKALGFIHNRGYLHNDFKENNVVLHYTKAKWSPVIIDFGKSVRISMAQHGKKKDPKYYHWIAPEVLSGGSCPSTLSDIFSLGRIIRFVAKKVMNHSLSSYSSIKELYLSCISDQPGLRPKTAQAVAARLSGVVV